MLFQNPFGLYLSLLRLFRLVVITNVSITRSEQFNSPPMYRAIRGADVESKNVLRKFPSFSSVVADGMPCAVCERWVSDWRLDLEWFAYRRSRTRRFIRNDIEVNCHQRRLARSFYIWVSHDSDLIEVGICYRCYNADW